MTASRANWPRAMPGSVDGGSALQWPSSISRCCADCQSGAMATFSPNTVIASASNTAAYPPRTTLLMSALDRFAATSGTPYSMASSIKGR